MDLLAVTDFPDIRFKCTIQAGNGNSILLIPREGGHLFRLYVDMGEIAPDTWLTQEEVLAQAQGVLAPYTLDVKERSGLGVPGWAPGHRQVRRRRYQRRPDRAPRVLLAGDACHTHTAKAGQGMNVSMADTYNLGWKLAAVLQGRSPARLLHTYNHERHGIAEDLIAMDTRWSKAIGAAQVDPSNPQAALIGLAEVQRQFVTNLDFTAGMATNYDAGPLTGENTHLHLATGYEPGRRFHSAEVVRLSDAKRLHLGTSTRPTPAGGCTPSPTPSTRATPPPASTSCWTSSQAPTRPSAGTRPRGGTSTRSSTCARSSNSATWSSTGWRCTSSSSRRPARSG
jgi:phenol 2-monooxygenase